MPYIGRSEKFGVRNRFYYTQASGGATSISGNDDAGKGLSFTDGAYVDVALNGVTLVAGTDYNTTTANTIAGLSALSAGDIIEILVYDVFNVADTVSATSGGTFSGGVAVTGDLTVDTSTLKVDSTNNYVGIGTASPSRTLTVNSGTTNTAFRLESTDAEVAMQFYDGTKTSTIQGGTSGLSFYPNTTVDKALAITATGQIRTTNRDFGFHNHLTAVSLADDASIVINAGTAGVGMLVIYETASGTNALYRIGYGSCAVLSGSGAVTMTNSDTDGAVCVFSSGHTITIKNRLGATKAFYINTFMAGNNF